MKQAGKAPVIKYFRENFPKRHIIISNFSFIAETIIMRLI